MPKEFLDYPIVEDNGLYYIQVDTWANSKIVQELWNSENKTHFAQYAVRKDWGIFKAEFWYIWLREKQ